MSEQTEKFEISTEEDLVIIKEEPTTQHDEEPPQEIKDGIQKIIINDLVNNLDEKLNKKVVEKVQCEKCGKSMSNLSNILINADPLRMKR